MVSIRVHCPVCETVEVGPRDIDLRVPDRSDDGTYTFRCPSCRDLVTKPTNAEIIQLLLSGGVRMRVVAAPAEALEPKSGPPLTYDDLLDFMVALDATDTLAALPEMPCV